MVAIREARRVAKCLQHMAPALPLGGTPADTTAKAQVIQDTLLRRLSPVEKLAQVVRLSRMVDRLAIEGLKQRHPAADDAMIQYFRAELRLGSEVAARVYRSQCDGD